MSSQPAALEDSEHAPLAAADEWYYCPVCRDRIGDDPTPTDLVKTRFSGQYGFIQHLLESHDKAAVISELVQRVEKR